MAAWAVLEQLWTKAPLEDAKERDISSVDREATPGAVRSKVMVSLLDPGSHPEPPEGNAGLQGTKG